MDASPDFPRQSRVPVFNMPSVVTAAIGLMLAIQALRDFVLPETWDIRLVLDLALVPARWTIAIDPAQGEEVLKAAVSNDAAISAAREAFARYLVAEPDAAPWTFASYALLHGSWMHVIFNCVWLAAFGSPVARRCGPWRFGLLALAGTVAGGALHVALDPLSLAPLVGASAGISALMAAAARFVFQAPPPGYGSQPWQRPPRRPLESIPELMRNRSAVVFLGIWLVTNLLFGAITLPLGAESAAVAWDAHLGGFVVGFLLFPFIDGPGPDRA
ncbi:rhomboid family intramembrane serine protease [Methylobacterium durans]|uniref:rhomboid family intramembrane serine protease n=1 Tax=Methylobacterium durans TaxID=2202825 RepID=UPI002AFFE512|nr:rhomboid family intramembrane serine protease [Methylobacterium durans]MEA1833592.1 rhomboid family intramembrane serine protease [Methylobacterium durans]